MGDAQNQHESQKNNHKLDSQKKGSTVLPTQTIQTLSIRSTCTKHNIIWKIIINQTSCYYFRVDNDSAEPVILFHKNIWRHKTRQYMVATIGSTDESRHKFRYVSRKIQVFCIRISHPTKKFNGTVNINLKSKHK